MSPQDLIKNKIIGYKKKKARGLEPLTPAWDSQMEFGLGPVPAVEAILGDELVDRGSLLYFSLSAFQANI